MPTEQFQRANNRSALLVLAALVPLALLASILAFVAIDWQAASTEAEAQTQANLLRVAIDRFIDSNIQALRVLSHSRALDAGNLASFYTIARRSVDESKDWKAVVLADLQGNELVNTRLPFGAALAKVTDRIAYERLLTSQQAVVSTAMPDPMQPSTFIVSLLIPVLRDGALRYVLMVALPLSRFGDIVESHHIQAEWSPFIADSAGRVVSVPRRPNAPIGAPLRKGGLKARAERFSGTYKSYDADGADVVTVFSRSPETNWSAHIAIPGPLYRAPLNRLKLVLLIAGLLTVSCTTVFVWLLKRDYDSNATRIVAEEHSRRLEALGRVAGGVAHDFNNLLMAIRASLALLKKGPRDGERADRLLETALLATARGAELTRQLLSFSRKQELKPEVVNVAEELASLEHLLQSSFDGRISFKQDAPPDLHVEVDRAQFQATLLNLSSNAVDAMPEGGTLSVTARRLPSGGTRGSLPRGEYAVIAVCDTGVGMDAATAKRAAEPFYSTKGQAGTGLGLSSSIGFARQSRGDLFITSEPGRGTTIEVWLPLADVRTESPAAAAPVAPVVAEPMPQPGRAELGALDILLVDDDPLVALATAGTLEDLGHNVVQVTSGAAALATLDQRRFDVLVTDFRMPQMTGVELIKKVRTIRPTLPAIIVSGYTEAVVIDDRAVPVIAKPVDSAALAAEICRLVTTPQAGDGGSPAAANDATPRKFAANRG